MRTERRAFSAMAFCVALLALLLCVAATAQAAPPGAPSVSKIEPPNWWAGLTRELMVMLTGENLEGANVSTAYTGVQVTKVDPRPGGRYLFVWLRMTRNAQPGVITLTVRTPGGNSVLRLPLRARTATDDKFLGINKDDVIYLIMPDRFVNGDTSNDNIASEPGAFDRSAPRAFHGGDFRGLRSKLPYLKELGITALWLTPFWRTGEMDYHGYHTIDHYATEEHLGTLEELKALVSEARALGIKFVIDYVVNHTGTTHPWVKAPPTPTWYNGTPEKHLDPLYNFNGLVDPHASPRQYRATVEGWFAGVLPDLNTDDPLVAQYLFYNAVWWTELTGLDAYRLDTFPYSSRRFWANWHERLFRAYPKTFTIGESWDGDPAVTAFFQGGRKQYDGVDVGVNSVFDFPLMYAFRDVIARGQSAQKLVEVLRRDSLYPRHDVLVTFIGNHDIKRFLTEAGSSREKLKLATSLFLTMRGIPQLYYGDELNMEGGDDPDNRRLPPGGHPDDSRNAFTAQGRTPEEQDVYSHTRQLLALRKQHAALRHGRTWHIGWGDKHYAFLREHQGERLLVFFHNGDSAANFSVDLADTPLAGATSLESVFHGGPARIEGNTLKVEAAPRSLGVYRVR